MNGNILDQTAIVLNTGARLNGRALAQSAVTLDASTVTVPTASTVSATPATPAVPATPSVNAALQSQVDGLMATLRSLQAQVQARQQGSPASASAFGQQVREIAMNLGRGVRDNNVAILQQFLIKENKGPGNPILSQDDRAKVMAALECVDYVTFFDELSPIRILKELKPSILVKGGNFDPEHIVGKDVVTSYRGEVKVIPLVQSQSGERLEKMIHIQKMTITKTRILDPT